VAIVHLLGGEARPNNAHDKHGGDHELNQKGGGFAVGNMQ
jgi:hypothetical protein